MKISLFKKNTLVRKHMSVNRAKKDSLTTKLGELIARTAQGRFLLLKKRIEMNNKCQLVLKYIGEF